MSPYPYAMFLIAQQHQQDLINDADQYRLLSLARSARRNRRAGRSGGPSAPARGHPATATPRTA